MHSPLQHEDEIVRYLLGEMEEPELLVIENRLMSDSNFFAEVRALEDELIDSYLNGELSGPQEKRFREQFLVTAKRREQLQFAQALRRHLRENGPGPLPGGLLGNPRTAAAWIIATLLVLCVIEAILAGRFSADLRREEQHVAGLKRELQATAADRDRERRNSLAASGIHIVPLQPVTRDAGKKVMRDSAPVFLELQLPVGQPGDSFSVQVQDQEGKAVARFEHLFVATIDSTRVVLVPLPPETIPDGDFNLFLEDNSSDSHSSTPLRYSFRIMRP